MGRSRTPSKDSTIDSDLEELIGKNGVRIGGEDGGANTAASALNLDHLTNLRQNVAPSKRPKKKSQVYYGQRKSFSEHFSSYLSMLCYFYPRACGCLVFGVILFILVLLSSLVWNPSQEYGVIRHDHSNIRSKYDLTMGEIDHWCLGGGDDRCRCEDPLIPVPRNEFASWIQALKANRQMLKRFENDPKEMQNLDVAILGESIVEEMDGRWLGKSKRPGMDSIETIFKKRFSKASGGHVEGVALGIAGDTAPNVLWRLLHGEMPDHLQPKVWWLSLGNNDLGRMECSEEVVVLGILRVVEEILDRRPNAHVVINSLFPMTAGRGGLYPVISDYKDSINNGGRRLLGQSLSAAAVEEILVEKEGFGLGRSRAMATRHTKTEEEMADAAEKEEVARDKKASRKKDRRYKAQKRKRNPKMQDHKRIRKYKVGGPGLMRKAVVPLWTSIRSINKELKNFADKQDRVTFFDSTPIFVKKSNKAYTLLTDRISIRGHPTMHGFALWEDEMIQKLVQILDRMKTDQPDLFKSPEPPSIEREGGAEDTEVFAGVRRSNNDDLDDQVFNPRDDGFGVMDDDGDPDPSTDEIENGVENDDEDGDLVAGGGTNGDGDKNGKRENDNDEEVEFRHKGSKDSRGENGKRAHR